MSNIRLNWVAILVAAIASFIFEALWFSVFMNEWPPHGCTPRRAVEISEVPFPPAGMTT